MRSTRNTLREAGIDSYAFRTNGRHHALVNTSNHLNPCVPAFGLARIVCIDKSGHAERPRAIGIDGVRTGRVDCED